MSTGTSRTVKVPSQSELGRCRTIRPTSPRNEPLARDSDGGDPWRLFTGAVKGACSDRAWFKSMVPGPQEVGPWRTCSSKTKRIGSIPKVALAVLTTPLRTRRRARGRRGASFGCPRGHGCARDRGRTGLAAPGPESAVARHPGFGHGDRLFVVHRLRVLRGHAAGHRSHQGARGPALANQRRVTTSASAPCSSTPKSPTATPATISDELMERLHRHFTERRDRGAGGLGGHGELPVALQRRPRSSEPGVLRQL